MIYCQLIIALFQRCRKSFLHIFIRWICFVSSRQLTLNSQTSYDSRVSLAQIFTKTATYKGQLVAVKRYKKKAMDITRNMKKEMKIVSKFTQMIKSVFFCAFKKNPNHGLRGYLGGGGSWCQKKQKNPTNPMNFQLSIIVPVIAKIWFLKMLSLHRKNQVWFCTTKKVERF